MIRILIIILIVWIGYEWGYDEGQEDYRKDIDGDISQYIDNQNQIRKIDSLTWELQKYNEGGHMVISRFHPDTIYVPMSNTEEIRRLANEIREVCRE